MARIRTVKPELWTDPEFVECSLSARLLFIASWNFATDHGVIPNKPRQIKMQCLPADDVDIEALIEELVSHQFLVRRTAPNGDRVLVIRTFAKNQKINRATDGRWGNPANWPDEPTEPPPTHGVLTEQTVSEGKGREGIVRKGREDSPSTYLHPAHDEFGEVISGLFGRVDDIA
jgi:hypothetical protein